MRCETYPLHTLGEYRYVVILSMYRGRLLLSRHRERATWETQGGHIEAEKPLWPPRAGSCLRNPEL